MSEEPGTPRPPAPKSPPLFSSFFEAQKAKLFAAAEKRQNDAIQKTMAPRERLLALSETIARGREASQLLDSDFWRKDVEPFLRSAGVLKPARLKDNDPAPADRAYHEYLIGSGRVLVVTDFVEWLHGLVKKGEDAEAVLAVDAEKRSRLREVA